MSTSVFATPGETPASFKRWDIPVKMGLLIGIVSVLLSTVSYMYIMPMSYVGFLVATGVIFIIVIVLYGFTGAKQRKAMGGYITLKDAFAAIFVAILISTAISTIWGIIYSKYIDPQLLQRIKESTISFMEGMNMPQDKLDNQVEKIDKEINDSMKPAQLLLSYGKSLIVYSIFGFICAAIVKRTPKQQML